MFHLISHIKIEISFQPIYFISFAEHLYALYLNVCIYIYTYLKDISRIYSMFVKNIILILEIQNIYYFLRYHSLVWKKKKQCSNIIKVDYSSSIDINLI